MPGIVVEPLEGTRDERDDKLSKYLREDGHKVRYEYDFGDGWMHEILLEKILLLDSKEDYPQLVKGVKACPPEDCGGVGGYYDLLEILKNPKDSDYQERLEWLGIEDGQTFDPEFFDPKSVIFQDSKDVEEFYKEMQP